MIYLKSGVFPKTSQFVVLDLIISVLLYSNHALPVSRSLCQYTFNFSPISPQR